LSGNHLILRCAQNDTGQTGAPGIDTPSIGCLLSRYLNTSFHEVADPPGVSPPATPYSASPYATTPWPWRPRGNGAKVSQLSESGS
jgi:hypothetical protein